jgi:hypothetical protein
LRLKLRPRESVKWMATDLKGWPAKRLAKCSVQPVCGLRAFAYELLQEFTAGFAGLGRCFLQLRGAVGPSSDVKAAVGRQQRRHCHAARGQQRHPGAVGTEPRPAAAAQGQHHRIGLHPQLAAGR